MFINNLCHKSIPSPRAEQRRFIHVVSSNGAGVNCFADQRRTVRSGDDRRNGRSSVFHVCGRHASVAGLPPCFSNALFVAVDFPPNIFGLPSVAADLLLRSLKYSPWLRTGRRKFQDIVRSRGFAATDFERSSAAEVLTNRVLFVKTATDDLVIKRNMSLQGLGKITLNLASLSQVTDSTVRENGTACTVKAWKSGGGLNSGNTDFELKLTEFANLDGVVTYFRIPEYSNVGVVDDELIKE